MIVFLGDSFTWGQGLYFEEWVKRGKTIEDINKINGTFHEALSYEDHQYRKEKHFPNLVAKYFNKHYDSPIITNGGSNWHILNHLYKTPPNTDLTEVVIVQFTYPLRNNNLNHIFKKFKLEMKDQLKNVKVSDLDIPSKFEQPGFENDEYEYLKRNIKIQFDIFKFICENREQPVLAFSWHPEIAKLIKKYMPNNFIPIIYEDLEFDSFEEIMYGNDLILSETLNCFDQHFNSKGNEVIANSIIKKIESLNIL